LSVFIPAKLSAKPNGNQITKMPESSHVTDKDRQSAVADILTSGSFQSAHNLIHALQPVRTDVDVINAETDDADVAR